MLLRPNGFVAWPSEAAIEHEDAAQAASPANLKKSENPSVRPAAVLTMGGEIASDECTPLIFVTESALITKRAPFLGPAPIGKDANSNSRIMTAAVKCGACRTEVELPSFTMAFQPIVDIETRDIYAYEALVRPTGGGTAADVLEQITNLNRYSFDQACRVKAIELAARLEMVTFLSINFLPNAVYQPAACLQKTFEAAERANFPLHHLIFEVTENEPARDVGHLQSIFKEYRRHGMITAIDDFGAGHSGLNMLADFQPDLVKIDMALTRAIHTHDVRRKIASAIIGLCKALNITVVAEGIETVEEAALLRELGVRLFQGYLFARPAVEQLPRVSGAVIDAVLSTHETLLLGSGTLIPQLARA